MTDILNSEVLGYFMNGGEAAEVIAMFEETVEKTGIIQKENPVSEDLNEEIVSWLDEGLPNEEELIEHIKETARHFADWQKQQIMKETIDAEILEMPDDGNTFFEHTHLEICVENLSKEKYMNGDKVKLIIIKED